MARKYTLAQRRKDPAKRSKLPMSKLTPAQQAQRRNRLAREKDAKNPLYNPAAQLTGTDLRKAAESITNAALNPKLAALDRQSANATTQGTALSSRAGDYYRQLAEREAGAVSRQQALGSMLDRTLAIGREGNQARFDDLESKEKARATEDASVRGGGLQGDTSTLQDLAVLRSRQNEQSQAVQDTASQQTANWGQYQNVLGQGRQLRGGEVQGQLLTRLANKQSEIGDSRVELEATRGDSTMDNLTKLRQQAYENLVVNKELGIKEQDLSNDLTVARAKIKADNAKAKQDAKDKAAKRALDRQLAEIRRDTTLTATEKRIASQEARDRANRASRERIAAQRGNGPGKGGKEPAAAVTTRRTIDNVHADVIAVNEDRTIKRLAGIKDPKKRRQVVAGIIKSRAPGLPQTELSAALDLYFDGHVSRGNARALEGYGVDVSKLRPRKTRARPRSTSAIPANKR